MFFKKHKEVLLVIAASIIFPCFQSFGGYLSTSITDADKNRSQITRDFSQYYSLYLSYADEYYLEVCDRASANRNNSKDSAKTSNADPKGNDYAVRVTLKKNMLDIRQPDAMLAIIQYEFNDRKIQSKARKLAGYTSAIVDSLQCQNGNKYFNDQVVKANDIYIELLKLMSQYSYTSGLTNNLLWRESDD